jgi:predicted RNA-binding Zn ribbon-like protein
LAGAGHEITKSSATGRWLCLLFCNTVENYRLEKLDDFLPDFDSWVKWSARHGLISAQEGAALSVWGEAHAGAASRALEEAKELRVRLFRLLSAHAGGDPAPPNELSFLNRQMASALGHLKLHPANDALRLGFEDKLSPERLMWPIVYSAASLLTDPQNERLRRCGGDKCTWLFIDQSKNHSRRWCDMKVCGNRAKSRAHYRKTRAVAG